MHELGKRLFRVRSLSVSTIGSYFLKPGHATSYRKLHIDFQYPLLDRISWNRPKPLWFDVQMDLSVSTIGSYFLKQAIAGEVVPKPKLSVSTIGSYFLKLAPAGFLIRDDIAFSIHYWIVFLETFWFWICRGRGCGFQYPLLDRISWNTVPGCAHHPKHHAFSIHYWIVFLETT